MQGDRRRGRRARRGLIAFGIATAGAVGLVLLGAGPSGAEEGIPEPTFEGVPLSASGLASEGSPVVAVLPVADPAPALATPPAAAAAEAPGFRSAEAPTEPTFNGVPLSQSLQPQAPRILPEVAAPAVPARGGDRRHIVYSVRQQRVWLVEDGGEVSKSYLVSGRAGIPRAGTYSVFSKSERASSGSVTMRHMIRFARGRSLAIGFHAIPVRGNGSPIQTLAQLGTYRSHGCVRQSPVDAEHLWRWAPVGTRVVVTS